nr:ribonuclease H-like domain-containing protein [Tanacetum cinerariifolium]
MMWSGYAVLMYGKTYSIKMNNNSGCLSRSTFVYNEVFKLDFFLSLFYPIRFKDRVSRSVTTTKDVVIRVGIKRLHEDLRVTAGQGEYDMWMLRIEQYFQVHDYALWDVIENGNSFMPVPQTTTNAEGTSTTLIPGLVTTKEKAQKKNDVKAR